MKRRCYASSHQEYKNYGGRGIKICDEWFNDFVSFYEWAINNGYQDDLTIDRIDNDGNYEPKNCQWISLKENVRKARIKYTRGKEKKNDLRNICRSGG
jgi:hypothetical protein